ncbi:hypothetical protein VKT23_017389 [Stygiomarasmius scandens]|uniref:F-box domain-containing protein n=1 Tax=Marasmiellus scandens TaxID=2682957 RepID=A0ABR1IV60_9AGAR
MNAKPYLPITIDRFRSMDMPSETEIAQMRPLVDECQLELDNYSEEIEKLSEILTTLKRKRDELQAYRDRQTSFFSPVRKLPVEILTEIFSLCCDTGLVINDKVSASALSLSQTCSFWHRVMLSRPGLWSTSFINLCKVGPDTGPCLHDLLKIYLFRSANGPGLSFEVTARTEYQYRYVDEPDSEGWSIFETLLRARESWKRASFDLNWELYSSDMSNYVDGSVLWPQTAPQDKLEHLSIKWLEGQEPPFNEPTLFWEFRECLIAALSASSRVSFPPKFPVSSIQIREEALCP